MFSFKTVRLIVLIVFFGPQTIQCLPALSQTKNSDVSHLASPIQATRTNTNCITRNVTVDVYASNNQVLYPKNPDQRNVSQFIQDLAAVDPTLLAQYVGPNRIPVSKCFRIETVLCNPHNSHPDYGNSTAQSDKILVLTYGVGFDRSYWDATANSSYHSFVEFATQNGYSTLSYDRLGVGGSEKADPLSEVQSYTDAEILHGLIALLRQGKQIQSSPVDTVIGVAHSYGSIIQLNNNLNYPDDLNASVVTGISSALQFLPQTVLSNNPSIAALNDANRFGQLPTSYLVTRDNVSIAQPFFHYPYYSEEILEETTSHKGLYTIGQLLTLSGIFAPAVNYSKPVDVVLGQNDFSFCGGDCNYNGTDLSQSTLQQLWPSAAASSQHHLVPNAGHCINLHSTAHDAYQQIIDFLGSNFP